MLGLMSICDSDELVMAVVPNDANPNELLVMVKWHDVEVPAIPILIPDLIQVLEVLGALKKTRQK